MFHSFYRCVSGSFELQTLSPVKWSRLNLLLFGLNVGVIGAGTWYLYVNRPATADIAQDTEGAQETALAAESEPQVVTVTVTNEVAVTNDFRWRQLESEDYSAYVQRLREIGCPEQTIRDIIIADIDKLLAPRLQSLKARRQDLKYWHPEEEELANNTDQREVTRQERAIDNEKRQILQELLGVDLVRERLKQRGDEDYYERRLAFLPEEKRGVLRQLLEDYDEREQNLRQKADEGEFLTAADQAELRRIETEREAQLSNVLTPEELTQYELWLSPTANAVRQSVYGMNATEEEFLSIYNLRKQFDEKWGEAETLGEGRVQQWQQAKAELENELRAQLGEKRYGDLKRGEDPEFHHLNAIVSRHRLPRHRAYDVYELKRSIQSMREVVQNDSRLGPEQKAQAMTAMNQEAEIIAKELLGEKALNSYLRRGQGSWLVGQ